MTDLLIRNVPDEVVADIDSRAKRLGLSRTEYLRRLLDREGRVGRGSASIEDLTRSAKVFADLDNPEVMRKAWE